MRLPPLMAIAFERRGRRATGVAVGLLLVVASGCGLDEARKNAVSPILGDGISDEIDALELVDPLFHEKLDDCVSNVQLKALGGDPEWQQVWQDSGQDVSVYRQRCEHLAKNEPDEFRALHLEWVAFEASTSTGVSEPGLLPPTAPPAVSAPMTTPPR